MLLLLMMVQTTDTTCTPSGISVVCQSTTNRPISQSDILLSGRNSVPDYAEQSRRQQAARLLSQQADALALQSQRQYLYQRVGKLVSEQKCDDAVKIALKGGDFDLAERAKAMCK